jgi:hypothetical protein
MKRIPLLEHYLSKEFGLLGRMRGVSGLAEN